VFEDFAYGLYAAIHRARGSQTLERYSAYLFDTVLAQLRNTQLTAVEHIVIGGMRVSSIVPDGDGGVTVTLDFESNFTERTSQGEASLFQKERWALFRKKGAVSREPSKARVFGCPSCGAPQDGIFGGQCKYCGKIVATGDFDWLVVDCTVFDREYRRPMLTSVAEEGTQLATVVDPFAKEKFAALSRKDASVSWASLTPRINLIFSEFQAAWTERNLLRMRALLTDCLFDMQSGWVEAYLKANLTNVVDKPKLWFFELARVESDPFFDAITVRVFAESLDYTVDAAGKLMSGSRTITRKYTEYWTLIRGTARRGAPKADSGCPNCGAPLKVNMTGNCSHCNVKITSGDFDWVLSRIEQDEAYRA
jgi:Tim44-like domain